MEDHMFTSTSMHFWEQKKHHLTLTLHLLFSDLHFILYNYFNF